MGLSAFVDAVAIYLRGHLAPAPVMVDSVVPDGPAHMPAVTLSLGAVTVPHPAVGATPRASVTGALGRSATIDLAAPYIDFPGERVQLLSSDSNVLQLPQGALVRSDGTQQTPFTGGDLTVTLTVGKTVTPYTVVAVNPGDTDVLPDPLTGALHFGKALPSAGRLDVVYFVGTWDVHVEHFAGDLRVDAIAVAAAEADSLSRRVEIALGPDQFSQIAGLGSLVPTGWGPLSPAGNGAWLRSLTYRFDYEHEAPVVVTAGGPVQTVHVTATLSVSPAPGTNPSEQFDVTRKAG